MVPITTREMYHVKDLADAYKDAPDESSIISGNDIRNFHRLVNAQFTEMSKFIYFGFMDTEPYGEHPKIKEVLKDFRAGFLKIHTTGNDSPIWGTFYNLQFRGVHDFIHCIHNLEFNHWDEVKALEKQMEHSRLFANSFPNLDWDIYYRILRSEIVYQSAFKEAYGDFHIEQKIILSDL